MIQRYPSDERHISSGQWGLTADTFYTSSDEKYLGFHDLVAFTHTVLNGRDDATSMKLHRNIELINIVLHGAIGFYDNNGGISSFPENSLQVTSAGKGMYQREFNAGNRPAELIQIGFLPDRLNTNPLKTKGFYDLAKNKNEFVELVSPKNPSSLSIQQHAAVLLGEFDKNQHIGYAVQNNLVGLFVYIAEGEVLLNNQILRKGDSAGIIGEEQSLFHTIQHSRILIIEVSLNGERIVNENIHG